MVWQQWHSLQQWPVVCRVINVCCYELKLFIILVCFFSKSICWHW